VAKILGVVGSTTVMFLSLAAAHASPVVRSMGGSSDPGSIVSTVDQFRNDLGTLNANVAGSFGTGRREINWDGVPDALSAPNSLPANFFNANSPRGVVFSTPGSGFQVSANSGVGPVRFGNLNPTYSNTFSAFSPQRLFTAIGSNIVDVNFFVPGSSAAALTNGFGAVFTDVELANLTRIDFFGASNNLLLSQPVLPGTVASGSLSFQGVSFTEGDVISRVRLVSGSGALGPDNSASFNAVAMDDFVFGEPVAVPEPASASLLAGALGTLWLLRRRRDDARGRALTPRSGEAHSAG
jgi:hypothetical protein